MRKHEKQISWWVHVERKINALNLDEKAREQVLQALAQKTPRPTEEEMVKGRKEAAGWEAYFENLHANREPDAPPLVSEDCGTTEKDLMEKTGLKIKWERRGPYARFDGSERERRYYLALARSGSNGKDEVITKLGYIPDVGLRRVGSYSWAPFWYGIHRALCLASVDLETYDTAMQLIGCRVTPPIFEKSKGIPFMNNQTPFKWRHARSRYHFAVRPLVSPLLTQLSRTGRDDEGTGSACRSHDHLPLGATLCARTGATMQAAPQSHH